MLVEIAVRQIVEATRTAITEALAEISAHLEQGRTDDAEAFLERTREESASVVRLMEEVLDNAADVGIRTEKKYEEAHRLSVERQEQLNLTFGRRCASASRDLTFTSDEPMRAELDVSSAVAREVANG